MTIVQKNRRKDDNCSKKQENTYWHSPEMAAEMI